MDGKSQFTWKGEPNRPLRAYTPWDGKGVGYILGSDSDGNGVTIWITDKEVFNTLSALLNK